MSDSEENSTAKFYVIGVAVVVFIGFASWAYRSYQKPMRITPKEGHILADKFGDSKLDSATVAPLPGTTPDSNEGEKKGNATSRPTTLRPALTKEQYRESTNAWLTGRVTLKGTPPAEKPLELDPECQADVKRLKLSTPLTRDYVMGTNGGLANVLVSVMNPPGDMPGELLEPLTIEIRGCQFHPFLTAVMTGQEIMIRNRDTDFHLLKGFPTNIPNPIIDFALLPGAPPPSVRFVNPEDFISIYTDQRRWMKGSISVLAHPFFGVTDSNGWFRIPRPPAGATRLQARHLLLPPAVQTVALNAKTNAPVHFVLEYQAPKEAAK
ncbi:MAG: hypothetical protein ACPGVU_01410 [Limisphaerales bacterium]